MNMYAFYMQYMYSISPEERERIDRGQMYEPADSKFDEYQGGLLATNGSDKDCVDL